LNWEEERVVQGDSTVAYEGLRYQLNRQHEELNLVRRKVFRAHVAQRSSASGVSKSARF
jgi:hypothetical protein